MKTSTAVLLVGGLAAAGLVTYLVVSQKTESARLEQRLAAAEASAAAAAQKSSGSGKKSGGVAKTVCRAAASAIPGIGGFISGIC